MELVQALISVGAVIVGGGIATLGAYLQHRWSAKREDVRRAEEARLGRIRADRDVIADLIVALYGYMSGIVNLRLAYDARGQGADLDTDRVREFQEAAHAFGPALVRARLAAHNPATRPVLDKLEEHHVRMSGHLNMSALGEPSPEFVAHFQEFHRFAGEAKVTLERAALTYDGVASAELSTGHRS